MCYFFSAMIKYLTKVANGSTEHLADSSRGQNPSCWEGAAVGAWGSSGGVAQLVTWSNVARSRERWAPLTSWLFYSVWVGPYHRLRPLTMALPSSAKPPSQTHLEICLSNCKSSQVDREDNYNRSFMTLKRILDLWIQYEGPQSEVQNPL